MKRLDLILGAAALFAVSLAATPSLHAQENGNRDEFGKIVRGPYETNRFGDNWFVGAGGGINMFWNDGFKPAIAPSIDAGFGKWFTPSVGMRMGYQGFRSSLWAYEPSELGSELDSDKGMYAQKFGYMYFHGDFLWNISNALSGYKETRFWNFVPYLHAGFFRSYGEKDVDFSNNELAAGIGLLHNLRLTNRLDLMVDMRGTVVNGRVHGADGVAILPSVTMGLAVDLGWPGFVRTSSIIGAIELANAERLAILETAAIAMEAANDALEIQNEDLMVKNAGLKKEVAALKQRPQMDPSVFFEDMTPAAVYFDIGKTVLSEKELQHLDFLARNLIAKADKETKIYLTIMGSADGNTGSVRRNQYLSEARGKYVFDLLTSRYGISKDRLVVKAEVIKKAADPQLSRAVVISF